jgi:hypothetical protein
MLKGSYAPTPRRFYYVPTFLLRPDVFITPRRFYYVPTFLLRPDVFITSYPIAVLIKLGTMYI